METYTVIDMADWAVVAGAAVGRARTTTPAVITLSGDLGAGKTTLVQHIARHLGITDTVTSPTFVIMHNYPCDQIWQKLVHIDAYRLEGESSESIARLKLSDYINDPHALSCIEWSEFIADSIPENAIAIHITLGEGEKRTVTIR